MPQREQLLQLASRQHGLVSRSQIRTLGYSADAASRVAASRDWEQLTRRVLRRAGAPPSDAQSALSIVLDVGHDAVLSHLSAARWWGLTGCSLTPLTVTTAQRTRGDTNLGDVHRVRRLDPRWVTVKDGVPVVRPELLALQLFAVCRPARAEVLVDRLWSSRLLCGRSVSALLGDYGARGRNGIAGLRSYLDDRGPAYVPPASNLENRVKRILADAGIEMRRQVDSGGESWTGRVDFRHPTLPLVLEVQSAAFHSALVDRRADERRRAALEAAGFVMVEVTDDAVWSRPASVVATVRAGMASALVPSSVPGGDPPGSEDRTGG